MQYLCLVYADQEKLRGMSGDEIRRQGRRLASEALQPLETATSVRVRNAKVSVTDGPFVETKEQLAGRVREVRTPQ